MMNLYEIKRRYETAEKQARRQSEVLQHIEEICRLTVGLPSPMKNDPASIMVDEIIAAINKAAKARGEA